MSSVRLRRLQADNQRLRDYVKRHPRLRLVQADGDPPERYQLEYRVKSLRQVDDDMQVVKSHMVEIVLPRNYPRTPPQCRMLSPVFHPNIAPHAICVGDHWSAGEPLWSIAARIGEMLAFQSYNTKSPLNGEAARWVDDNKDRLPLDAVSMLVDESATSGPDEQTEKRPRGREGQPRVASGRDQSTKTGTATSSTAQADRGGGSVVVGCTNCGTRYRVSPQKRGKRIRCKQCQHVFTVPSDSGLD